MMGARTSPPRHCRHAMAAVTLAAVTLATAAPLHAQTEIQVGGVWVSDAARGPYLGALHEWPVGPTRMDTTWVDLGDEGRQAVPRRTGRLWTITAWVGGGMVDGPRGRGLEAALHGQFGVTRRRPSSVVDRVGVLADVHAVRWGVGASAAIRLKTAFWLHAGVMRSGGTLRPSVGMRLQGSLLTELGRFIS